MLNKTTTSYRKSLLSFILAALALIASVTVSFAWFYNQNNTDISFTAGDDTPIQCFYSTYENDAYQWSEYANFSSSTTVWDQQFTATSNLHLGTVDNLSVRTENNVMWFSLKIKTAGHEKFTDLRLSLSDTIPMRLYTDVETTPKEITDSATLDSVKNYIEKLIKIDSLIVSSEDYTKFFTSTSITVPDPNANQKEQKAVTCTTPLDTTVNVADLGFSGEFQGTTEYYYVYFRVYPELREYAKVAEFIALYMPCVIQFNIQLDISFGIQQTT